MLEGWGKNVDSDVQNGNKASKMFFSVVEDLVVWLYCVPRSAVQGSSWSTKPRKAESTSKLQWSILFFFLIGKIGQDFDMTWNWRTHNKAWFALELKF